MCFFSAPKAPAPPPPPPPPPSAPKPVDEQVKRARKDETQAAKAAAGRASTILTGPAGLVGEPETSRKTLLGM